jgi:proliferating cell nuclear antigen
LPPPVTIEASKDGVKFNANGDIGNGSVTLRSHQDVEKPDNNIEIELTEPVSLTFSLKYLVNFCKAQPLSSQVKICLSNEVPLLVEYMLAGTSYLRFYLAPKVCPLGHPHLMCLHARYQIRRLTCTSFYTDW